MTTKIGVLLANLGTPDRPDAPAVKRYLEEFLSDRRVIEFPRFLWWPILHGFILRFRPKKSAELYRNIWTENGSPLLLYSQKIADKLQNELQCPVMLGMNYGTPSIEQALDVLRAQNVTKIIVLPLFPQYSATTTASTIDRVTDVLKKWRIVPEIQTINNYADHPSYIKALSRSIQKAWETQGRAPYLLFSFHGIPKSYADAGDPYSDLCYRTAHLVAQDLKLNENEWSLAFQSRLGRTEWLKPYTDKVLAGLPKKGITRLQVICPGFAADCLETLEEIAIRGQEDYLKAGGKEFYYIPALNDDESHISALAKIISSKTQTS